jgi:ABC-type bacteriocin/lantibiotic exporter with double-glycine peptidase domain
MAMLLLSAPLTLMVLVVVPLSVAGNLLLGKRLRQLTAEQQGQVGNLQAFTHEHLHAHAVVKALGLHNGVVASY